MSVNVPLSVYLPSPNQTIQAMQIAMSETNPQRCRNPGADSPESLIMNGPTQNNTHAVTRRIISGINIEAVLRMCSIVSGTFQYLIKGKRLASGGVYPRCPRWDKFGGSHSFRDMLSWT